MGALVTERGDLVILIRKSCLEIRQLLEIMNTVQTHTENAAFLRTTTTHWKDAPNLKTTIHFGALLKDGLNKKI